MNKKKNGNKSAVILLELYRYKPFYFFHARISTSFFLSYINFNENDNRFISKKYTGGRTNGEEVHAHDSCQINGVTPNFCFSLSVDRDRSRSDRYRTYFWLQLDLKLSDQIKIGAHRKWSRCARILMRSARILVQIIRWLNPSN